MLSHCSCSSLSPQSYISPVVMVSPWWSSSCRVFTCQAVALGFEFRLAQPTSCLTHIMNRFGSRFFIKHDCRRRVSILVICSTCDVAFITVSRSVHLLPVSKCPCQVKLLFSKYLNSTQTIVVALSGILISSMGVI